jgi:hypothetical protein
MARGGHILSLQAIDVNGQRRVFNWYFRIRHLKNENEKKEYKNSGSN